MSDVVPRRSRVDQYVPAETAIREAMLAVEAMPADERLTDAVVLLGKAKDAVADFVDGKPRRQTEFAWVIERGDTPPSAPAYWTGSDQGWSQNHVDAVRFARKEDAEKVAYHFRQPNCRICEHGWG